jgi:hypothetical protein
LAVPFITELDVVPAGAVCGGMTDSMVRSGSAVVTGSSVSSVFLHETIHNEANTSREKIVLMRYFYFKYKVFLDRLGEMGII